MFTHQKTRPRFIQFFFNLSKKEETEFIKLAASPFFSGKRSYEKLLKLLGQYKKKSKSDPGDAFFFLLESAKLSKRALWNRLSELNSIAEKFLVIKNISNDEIKEKSLLFDELSKRRDHRTMMLQEKPVLKLLSGPENPNETSNYERDILLNLSHMHTEKDDYETAARLYNGYSNLTALNFLTDSYRHLLDRELQKRNNIHQEESLAGRIAGSIDTSAVLKEMYAVFPNRSALLEIYYNLYNAFRNPDDSVPYFSAKKLFLQNSENINRGFTNSILQYLRNYCIEKTNLGNSEYYSEIFELNELILKKGLFSDLNVMNSRTNHFRNFIFAASRLSKFEWISNFIKEYAAEIPEENRDDEVSLSNALLCVYEKRFDTALEHLYKIKRKNYLHYMDTSVYKLIVFFEIGELEETRMEMARLKDYLRKHKEIPSYFKSSYQRFLAKFMVLLKLKEKPDSSESGLFIKEMEKLKYIGLGGWLYEKGTELHGLNSRDV